MCRQELPVVDELAVEFGGGVRVVAVAWASSLELTAAAAEELLPSGEVGWVLSPETFELFGVGYQPAAVLVVDGVQVRRWVGAFGEGVLRATFEQFVG